MCFDFVYKFCLRHLSFYEEYSYILSHMYIRIHVNYPLFSSDLNEILIFSKNFRKIQNINFHENPSSGSRVVPCGRKDGQADGQSNMTRLIFAFHETSNNSLYNVKEGYLIFDSFLPGFLRSPS